MTRPTFFFPIPAGTKASECKSCSQRIFWIEHRCKPKRKGEQGQIKRLPISVRHELALEPTDTTWGRGISHVADCPFAHMHVKGVRPRQQPQPIERRSPDGPAHARMGLVR